MFTLIANNVSISIHSNSTKLDQRHENQYADIPIFMPMCARHHKVLYKKELHGQTIAIPWCRVDQSTARFRIVKYILPVIFFWFIEKSRRCEDSRVRQFDNSQSEEITSENLALLNLCVCVSVCVCICEYRFRDFLSQNHYNVLNISQKGFSFGWYLRTQSQMIIQLRSHWDIRFSTTESNNKKLRSFLFGCVCVFLIIEQERERRRDEKVDERNREREK